MTTFSAVDVIRAKRDGGSLTDEQIDWVVDAYTKGVVADEQMSALAMAICCAAWAITRSPAGPPR
jgi:thymidine phosphorylase